MPERISVVMPARNEIESFREGAFINRVFEHTQGTEATVVVAVNNSKPEFVDLMDEMGRNMPNLQVLQLGQLHPKTFAYAYLEGLNHAIQDGADKVIEMDATGAHDPKYIPAFVGSLNEHGAALSSRFSPGGGIDRYPLQRKAISYGGTLAANLYLGLGGHYPDLTSGYEAFRREVLGDIFCKVPINSWISVNRGPGHFYQVEMRAYTIWGGNDIGIIPMKWGTDRVKNPNLLPWQTVTKALMDLHLLKKRRDNVKDDGKK